MFSSATFFTEGNCVYDLNTFIAFSCFSVIASAPAPEPKPKRVVLGKLVKGQLS